MAKIKLICYDHLDCKCSASDRFNVPLALVGVLVVICIGVVVGLQDLAIGEDLDQDTFKQIHGTLTYSDVWRQYESRESRVSYVLTD